MDRDTLVEIVAASSGAVVFITALLIIATRFSDDGITEQGGLALVAAIGFFIIFMTGVGYALSRRSA